MADYRQFEQNYPTLNKFVGAAREAAAMIPGAGYLTPQGQQYQDARTRFQQQNPNAAMAGTLTGLGVDAAVLAGLGGVGASFGARSAAAGARAEALNNWGAAQQAMQAAGSQGPIAAQGARAGLDAARQSAMAARTAYQQAPTLGQEVAGAFRGAPKLAAAIGGVGIGAGGAMIPNRGVSMRDQQEAAAKPIMDMDKAVWQARPDDSRNDADPNSHLRRMRLMNFMNNRPGVAPQHIPDGPLSANMPSRWEQQTDTLAEAKRQDDVRRANTHNMFNMPMFPGDDPSQPIGMRMLMSKLSPRPHYEPMQGQLQQYGLKLALTRYNERMKRAKNDAEREQVQNDHQADVMNLIARGQGPYGTMGAYGGQQQEVDPNNYGGQ